MSDAPATPPLPRQFSPAPPPPGFFSTLLAYLKGGSVTSRAILLTGLTLLLTMPLGLVGKIVTERQSYEKDAIQNVTSTWGDAQVFSGPMLVLPYVVATDKSAYVRTLTLLPEKLTIDTSVAPTLRRRGLFAVTVYKATLDVTAEFRTRDLQSLLADNRTADWAGARLSVGLNDPKSIDGAFVTIDGNPLTWTPDSSNAFSSIKAALNGLDLRDKENVIVRFKLSFGGSGSLSFVPLGRRTDVTVASSWQSPSYFGQYLPVAQNTDKGGIRAQWTTSDLGRRYGQIWDSSSSSNDPAVSTVNGSAFGFALINPVDAYRETDRAIKYAIMIIGLSFAVSLLFEMATGTQPVLMQYALSGLSLCIFYLLLLSFSEQIGFAAAYMASASAVVLQATAYNWGVHRRLGPALAFGAVLSGLYGGLYILLQLEDVALLSGSVLLFLILSLAMWFTRNLHRSQAA